MKKNPEATIIYYTANVEDEYVESFVKNAILKHNKGKYPIISVSRKPIDFGENICVGETEVSYMSAFKQLLIGLRAANTKFCIAAESDVLYPPEYFDFIPPVDDQAYRGTNIWVFHSWIGKGNRNLFWKKAFTEGAQIIGREFWIDKLKWSIDNGGKVAFKSRDDFSFKNKNPIVTIKTGHGMKKWTKYSDISSYQIPFWGSTDFLRKKIWGTNEIK